MIKKKKKNRRKKQEEEQKREREKERERERERASERLGGRWGQGGSEKPPDVRLSEFMLLVAGHRARRSSIVF